MLRWLSVRLPLAIAVLLAAASGVAAAWLLGSVFQTAGQTFVSSTQSTATSSIIDGSKRPDLIPDSTAYRLYLLTVAVAADASETQLTRQRAFLMSSGLRDEDIPSAVDVLADFRANYDELVKEYNHSVAQADKSGQTPDFKAFLVQRDALVQSVRDKLKSRLSPPIMARLDAHVQHEKTRMRVAKEVVQ